MQGEQKVVAENPVQSATEKKQPEQPKQPSLDQKSSKTQGEKGKAQHYSNQNHHGQHHHPHGQHHHLYHHVEPPLIIKTEDLVDPVPYLMNIYKTKQKMDSYFMKNTEEYVNYWKREYNVNFSVEGYQLINYEIVINMEEFLKQDWRKVEYIGFAGCKIDDIKWRLFADHADLFPNLKWLSLQIKHTINVKEGDLQKFKSLQRVQFNYEQWTHPLTIPSKNYLKAFAKQHPGIQVVFG